MTVRTKGPPETHCYELIENRRVRSSHCVERFTTSDSVEDDQDGQSPRLTIRPELASGFTKNSMSKSNRCLLDSLLQLR